MLNFLTPLVGAGVLNEKTVEQYESRLLRKYLRYNSQFKSTVLRNVFDLWPSTIKDSIINQARYNRLFVDMNRKQPTRKCKINLLMPSEQEQE